MTNTDNRFWGGWNWRLKGMDSRQKHRKVVQILGQLYIRGIFIMHVFYNSPWKFSLAAFAYDKYTIGLKRKPPDRLLPVPSLTSGAKPAGKNFGRGIWVSIFGCFPPLKVNQWTWQPGCFFVFFSSLEAKKNPPVWNQFWGPPSKRRKHNEAHSQGAVRELWRGLEWRDSRYHTRCKTQGVVILTDISTSESPQFR